jgi:Domain of unknown function (DUF5655)
MPTVWQHFKGRAPAVWTIYQQVLAAASAFGPFAQEAKKTSIHLVRKSAFAGVATRKEALILTLKSATDIRSRRIVKREQGSARRWHLEIRLDDPRQVDAQLKAWLKKSVDLSD